MPMPPRVIEDSGRRKKTGGQDEETRVCLVGPIVLGKATFKAGFCLIQPDFGKAHPFREQQLTSRIYHGFFIGSFFNFCMYETL
jgi:hypothetical protein